MVHVASSTYECKFNGTTYTPGLFRPELIDDAGPPLCPDSNEIPAKSKYPFWFGATTAAHKIEGAYAEGGKGLDIWQTFEQLPGKVDNGDTAAQATDFYNKFKEDVKMMRWIGVRNFRMSISWSRVFPSGRGPANPEGVQFYKDVFATLRQNCIEPHVTLYHWDFPRALHAEYGGWINAKSQQDFTSYAKAMFTLFKDDVKYWYTFDSPETFCKEGYKDGTGAPGRCSDRTECLKGNSTTEPWLCTYNVLNAHARAEKWFRQIIPDGKLGFVTTLSYIQPFNYTSSNKNATNRLMIYDTFRFLDVLQLGDWNPLVKKVANTSGALPAFTEIEQDRLKNTTQDFLAFNYFKGTQYGAYSSYGSLKAKYVDKGVNGTMQKTVGDPSQAINPRGLRLLLGMLKTRYNNPPMIITENAMAELPQQRLSESLCDTERIKFYQYHVGNATTAYRWEGANVQGYFAGSLMDGFEWNDGYSKRTGIIYTDYTTMQRWYKTSALWLANRFGLTGNKGPPKNPVI